MSEQLEREEHTYLQVLIKALNDSESGLSDAGVMELRRKLNTVNAIIHSIRPIFYEVLSLEKQVESRRESRLPLVLLIVSLVVGGVLHYSFRDSSVSFDFTFGMFIAAYGLFGWVVYGLGTERMARTLKDSQRVQDEMLYRWMANGGSEARFWELRDQMDVNAGGIDMETPRYRQWWHEMKGDLVDSIKGDTPGSGSWRPRS